MDYIIVSTSRCKYQLWQLQLLDWSRRKVGQKGKLILLMSEDISHHEETLNFEFGEDVEIIDLPDWAHQWKEQHDDWWGGIPNKFESFHWLTNHYPFKKQDVLLFLDPDMIFLDSVDYTPKSNEIVGQLWEGFQPLEEWMHITQAFMYPFVLNFSTAQKITNDFKKFSGEVRKSIKAWESDMWGLVHATAHNQVNVEYLRNFGRCTVWHKAGDREVSPLVHFPNIIKSSIGEKLFFKQDYTFQRDQKISVNDAQNLIDRKLLLNIAQERTDYLYHLKWEFEKTPRNYTGGGGYLVVKPWPGGFNNIRMSLELGTCLAFLTNRTLVLPSAYNMYLLEGESDFSDFFDLDNLGVSVTSFDDLCKWKSIESNEDQLKEISKVLDFDIIDNVINFEKIPIPEHFLKGRKEIRSDDLFTDEEILFFDKNLLGNFYLSLYTSYENELKKLVAKHVVYRNEIFDTAWQFINLLGDQKYYSIHIRRNDFQYKDLYISCEAILDNIKDYIPKNLTLYVATDHNGRGFFKPLVNYYNVVFYNDLYDNIEFEKFNINWTPIIEQLICARSIKFVGMKLSTLSSYVFRMRGYMNDIEDKDYYVNTQKQNRIDQCEFAAETQFIANWAREYKDGYDLKDTTIFVSIASYCDDQLIPTINDLLTNASNPSRILLGVHLQDTEENYDKFLSCGFSMTRVIFTKWADSNGVVWARNRIKTELYGGEDYFLQIDSHSRFKENWDNILIHQHKSIEAEKVIISTYPNDFEISDIERTYLDIATNSPLRIRKFLSEDKKDNRLTPENGGPLSDYEVVEVKWCSGGFLFASGEWVAAVNLPDDIVFNGEEDALTHLSYLNGYNLRLPSEACVWHNYNFKNSETGMVYKSYNENNIPDDSVDKINEILFGHIYERSVQDLELYLGHRFRRVKGYEKIYVSIAAYLDVDIKNTIIDCIEKARYPDNLVFGICWQYDFDSDAKPDLLNDLSMKFNMQIDYQNYQDSNGVGWARSKAMRFYDNERFCLQIDSHTRFITNWDEILIDNYNDLKRNSDRQIISYLPPSFELYSEGATQYKFEYSDRLDYINIPEIEYVTEEYWFEYKTNTVQATGFQSRNVQVLNTSFIFTDGRWAKEVQQDPDMYYLGEDVALSVRSYMAGFDFYCPKQVVSWHRKNESDLFKHYQTHKIEKVKKLHKYSMANLKKIIEGQEISGNGQESIRSLKDYMDYAGIDFIARKVYQS